MKIFSLLIVLALVSSSILAQNREVDSLTKGINIEKNDTARIVLLYKLSFAYLNSKPDSSLILAQEAYFESKKKNFIKGESWALNEMATAFNSLGNIPKALELYLDQLRIEQKRGFADNIAIVYLDIALLYENESEYQKAILFAKKGDSIIVANHYDELLLYSSLDLGDIYEKKNVLDSALFYTKKCYHLSQTAGNSQIAGTALLYLGNIYQKAGNSNEAFKNYQIASPLLFASSDFKDYADGLLGLAKLYESKYLLDSAIYYAKRSFDISTENQFLMKALDASVFLSQLYKKNGDINKAFAYQEIMLSLKDSIESKDKVKQFQNIGFSEQLRMREIAQENIRYRNKIWTNALLGGILACVIIVFLLYRNNQIRKNTNKNLEKQKDDLLEALKELKITQSQLIQSEKMASLGELTAGIAHEIQNPLNFVNNFSEVNMELIDEMQSELDKGSVKDVKDIAHDISENEKKINHHGKRADAIVKGMLQHSRTGSGQKESVYINTLVLEYLQLSYHGFRAKDKSVNATTKTDLDETLEKVNIIAQDFGRVLLNLYNNAFYSVAEKSKMQLNNYDPTVCVTTKKTASKLLIYINDNGNGIPQKVLDKIWQPFFTTKPTGQGTGLGLSISYDIIKAHGGELTVKNEEGSGAEFLISIPL